MACNLNLSLQILKHKTMKKIFYFFMILPLILLSCEKTPEASFFADTTEPEVGQEVFFTSDSRNAVEFEWDFGDGWTSNDENPGHIFTGTGTFEVKLTVWSKNNVEDNAIISINVQIPTLLEIEVLEYYQELAIPDASVFLYPTLIDWEGQKNVEAEGFTDGDGLVVFSHLGPYVYYVDVYEATHDNYALKLENVDYIRTGEIIPHKINRFTAWVDVVVRTKSGTARDRSYVIKKLERKPDILPQTFVNATTDGWQELYNKSIKVK
jgi:PKD repeat protein